MNTWSWSVLILNCKSNYRIKCSDADTIIVTISMEDRKALNVSGSWPPTRKKIRFTNLLLDMLQSLIFVLEINICKMSVVRYETSQDRLYSISISRPLSSEQCVPSQTYYQSNKNTWIITQTKIVAHVQHRHTLVMDFLWSFTNVHYG